VHKYFAKTHFVGKNVIYLPECHSTNDYLLDLAKKRNLIEGTLVITDRQTAGKGQRGNSWESEEGKNITVSWIVKPDFLLPSEQFLLTIITALSIRAELQRLKIDKVNLKWPNDVYVQDFKIAGILAESSLRSNSIEYTVLGLGLNVNQSSFQNEAATSVIQHTQLETDRYSILESILLEFEIRYDQLANNKNSEIIHEYHECLRWKGRKHLFSTDDLSFEGVIKGIDPSGRLLVQTEDGLIKSFNNKEISFIS
jgi:BirA family biotin operon repressor/biotin-[acetyl-CoA-carboxylase] ligase